MKRISIYIIVLCILLCGCKSNSSSEDIEPNETETTQSNYSEEEKYSESNTEEAADSMEETENTEKYIETDEEYIEKLNSIYSEIKDEISVLGNKKTEILFNEIPWMSNFAQSEEQMKKNDGYKSGAIFKGVIRSPYYFLCGNGKNNYEGSDYSEIGGITRTVFDEMKIAGYNLSDCAMYFVGIAKNGTYILSDEDSILYAACYTIESTDVKTTKEDLKTKISSVYGDPDNTREIEPYANAPITEEYIYWYGANDTVLVLSSDEGGRITISYVWLGGEELLKNALDSAENAQSESEESIYGDENTSGL